MSAESTSTRPLRIVKAVTSEGENSEPAAGMLCKCRRLSTCNVVCAEEGLRVAALRCTAC